jgi:hypothetical protein
MPLANVCPLSAPERVVALGADRRVPYLRVCFVRTHYDHPARGD